MDVTVVGSTTNATNTTTCNQNMAGNGDEKSDSDKYLQDLIQKVIRGFVSSLQTDSVDMWQSFNEVLEIIQPYSALVEYDAQLKHYVERAYRHYCDNPDCGLDINALSLAFPSELMKLEQWKNDTRKISFPLGSPDIVNLPPNKSTTEDKKSIIVPKGKSFLTSNTYAGNINMDTSVFVSQNSVQIGDLRKLLPFVVYEIGLRESSWGKPLGITATALNTDLADVEPVSPEKVQLSPVGKKARSGSEKTVKEKAMLKALTGREVVEKFITGYFLGKTKFAYLNKAPSRHYDPYDLIVVPRNKTEQEHFVVSTNAILHVKVNQPSELQPLSDWYREAVLFTAIMKVKIFKYFLINKMFQKWRRARRLSQFNQLRDNVGEFILGNIPSFGSPMLRISTFLQELDQVSLLPLCDTESKSLDRFHTITTKMLNDANECLKMFFTYCSSVINKTKENCFEYLEYCKVQLMKKSLNAKESMSLARKRKKVKKQNLKKAWHEVRQFEKFVKLIEQMLSARLLGLARYNIGTFVDCVLDSDEIKVKGFLKTVLQFDKSGKLSLLPPGSDINKYLSFAINSALKILCNSSDFLGKETSEDVLNSKKKAQDAPLSADSAMSDSLGLSPEFSTGTSSDRAFPLSACGERGEIHEEHDRHIQLSDTEENVKNEPGNVFQRNESEIDDDVIDESDSLKACLSPVGRLAVEGTEILRSVSNNLVIKPKLEETILNDGEILAYITKQEVIVKCALDEVQTFCNKHGWITEIHQFVKTWNDAVLKSWKGKSPAEIQDQLSQIKKWIEDLMPVTRSFCTENGLLFVDCRTFIENIIKKLNAIFKQLSQMVAKHILIMSKNLSEEVYELGKQLSVHPREPRDFAVFMEIHAKTKEKVPFLQNKVEYIKNFFEMIKSNYRQLTRSEEEAEQEAWSSWESFLLNLQESSDFLAVETAQVLRDLEETITILEYQARAVGKKATSKEFLIPENNPSMIIASLQQLRGIIRSLSDQIDELVECREVICGKKYDKSELLDILSHVNMRFQLWKYYEVSSHTIKDWLQVPFKKMNVKKVKEKITEWQEAAKKLKEGLSDDDAVHSAWLELMESFMKDFPLIEQLSNDALKQRHWKALFVSMGQQYVADLQFTVAGLYSFKLGLYKDIIQTICRDAELEHALELNLRLIAKSWAEREFKLIKHFAKERESETTSRQARKSRLGSSRTTDVYVLMGEDELKCVIEDNRVTLQLMLVSPHVADLKSVVEKLTRDLEDLEGILDLWVACQKRWIYLSSVFNKYEDECTDTSLAQFEHIDSTFREFTHTVYRSPKVLGVLARKRGEKGYREQQGETLRNTLLSLLQSEEELLKLFSNNMDGVRLSFPRFYFLSDIEVLDTIIVTKDPRKLIPVVRKCFNGIHAVKFALPIDNNTDLNNPLDAELKVHLLQAVALEGEFGEVMTLTKPVPAFKDSQTWLRSLETSMKHSLMVNQTMCILQYFFSKENEIIIGNEIGGKLKLNPGLLHYPSQCIRSSEVAKWTRDVYQALSSTNKDAIKALCTSSNERVEEYSNILSESEYRDLRKDRRIHAMLETLVLCAIHQREVARRLVDCQATCVHCFEWQSCLQHHISIKRTSSSTYGSEYPEQRKSSADRIPIDVKHELEYYNVQLMGSKFPYGFEFLTEKPSLIVTPLTERCFLALTMALEQYSCAVPYGYNGTGKTEIISELAKIMGRHLVFFKCSSSLAKSVVVQHLTGVVLNGSWICFDEANNLPQGMLCVLGEYLTSIRESFNHLLVNKDMEITHRKRIGITSEKVCENKKGRGLMRSHSVTSLCSLEASETKSRPSAFPYQAMKKCSTISRRVSIHEGMDLNELRYYEPIDKPAPIALPDKTSSPYMVLDCDQSSNRACDDGNMDQLSDESFLGNIVFNGRLLKARCTAGCFMTIAPSANGHLILPENLKVSLRTVHVVKPNLKRTVEALLICSGFRDVESLTKKIIYFIGAVRSKLFQLYDVSLNSLKTLIRVAGIKLEADESEQASGIPKEVDDPDDASRKSSSASFLDALEKRTKEENALVYGIFTIMRPKLGVSDFKVVSEVIDMAFTHTVLTSLVQPSTDRIAQAAKEQLKAESLLPNADLVSKVVQLYQVLQASRAVIIMGITGTGKTTIYQTLCRAVNSLNKQMPVHGDITECQTGDKKYPKVNLSVLFPRSMNENELFGCFDPISKLWNDGILVNRVRNAEAVQKASANMTPDKKLEPSEFHQWIVLDGPLDDGCMDKLNALFDGSRSLSLGTGEMVPLSDATRFLLEVDDIQNAAPSMVSRCGIVYCPEDNVGWKSIFKSWLKGAHNKWNISLRGLGIVSSLMDHCVEKTLSFLSQQCSSMMSANYYSKSKLTSGVRGVCRVQRLLVIISALFDKYISRDNDETFNILDNIQGNRSNISRGSSHSDTSGGSCVRNSDTKAVLSCFVYAFIWAFGGDLQESSVEAFDQFAKELLSAGPHPHTNLPPVCVFDYHLDYLSGTLLSSSEKLTGKTRTIASTYVVVPKAEVYFSLLDLLISGKKPVLLVGPSGSGKTSFMQHLVNSRYKYTRVSFANGMTAQQLHEIVDTKTKNAKRRLSVVNNKTILTHISRSTFFFDDFNAAVTDGTASNNQPLLEFVRSLLTLDGIYDKQRLCLRGVPETAIIAAAVPPGCSGVGGGVTNFPISPRLTRLMVTLSFFPVSGSTLRSIYRTLFQAWLEDFPAYSLACHQHLAKAIADSTVTLFEMITEEIRPTPAHPHYVFTQHDVARVLQGVLLFSSRTKSRPRPKAHHGRQQSLHRGVGDPLYQQSYSYHSIGNENHEAVNDLFHGQSYPKVSCKKTLVMGNSRTPAARAPLIRIILRLWCHECTRVFSDRLDAEDQLWFSSALHNTAMEQFCETTFSSEARTPDVFPERVLSPENRKLGDGTTDDITERGEHEHKIDATLGQSGQFDDLEDEKAGVTPFPDAASDLTESNADVDAGYENESEKNITPVNSPLSVSQYSTNETNGTSEESTVREKPMRAVTFEDMSKNHVYQGPLILPEHLVDAGEDLSRIVFSRHFVSATQEGVSDHDKGYNEQSVSTLAQGLRRCQQLYNSQESQVLDLVFFEQAVRHAARISRCLSMTSGHILLLSRSGHGRKSLVTLAAFATNSKLIKLKEQRRDLCVHRMKSALYLSGLLGKPVVLYVPENIDKNTMYDVCSLINEGNCPGLFTKEELFSICAELVPGSQKEKEAAKMAIAQERFCRRVRTNLHVVVCLKYEQPNLADNSLFSQFPSLLTRTSSIDVYQPWLPSVLTNVSSLRLSYIPFGADELRAIVNNQRMTTASIMSYIHTSASEMISEQFCYNQYECFSPRTFVELIDMFGKCCHMLWRQEQIKSERCLKVLAKVDEANNQIEKMQKDLDELAPILRNAEQEAKDCLNLVESLQKEYTEGRAKCKEQEVEIEKMMEPIADLERIAKIELDRVSPVFKSAYDALQALNVYDVEEIRSYRTPPEQVVLVVKAVCLLFDKEECWEEGKMLFSREDFIKDLEFFNMKEIPDRIFRRLKSYIDNPDFVPKSVKEGSVAAMSICIWIRAVYNFCIVFREYFPKQQRVVEAKKILEEAVAFLGDLRVRCNEIKADVETKIENYKEKVHHAKSIEKQIQHTEQKKKRFVSLMDSMSRHVKSWKKTLRLSQSHIKTLAGDALLLAGCLCYMGPLDQEHRDRLIADWKMTCRGKLSEDDNDDDDVDISDISDEDGDVRISIPVANDDKELKPRDNVHLLDIRQMPVRSDFSLTGLLSSDEELYKWRYSGLPSNKTSVENALMLRAVCDLASNHWPFLIDTDLQSFKWINVLHQDSQSKDLDVLGMLETDVVVATPYHDEELPLSSSTSPCPSNRDNESIDDGSTNFDESDSTSVHSSQSSRRTSAAASGPLIREELTRELDITVSPLDYTSSDSDVSEIDANEQGIVIVSAVDKQRDIKLCNAVSVGSTVILVDIERKNIGSRLNNLLSRNVRCDENGQRKIKIAGRLVDYHPRFRLYLYTNMPLELSKDSVSLAFSRCLAVNMAVSPQGLQEQLLTDILALEKPEYETECRSLEADIFHHTQEIKNAEALFFETVIDLDGKLLEEKSIPGSLENCDEICDAARQQLEESKALFEFAKEKQEEYAHVSEHAAALLLIVSKLSKLNNYYQFPLQTSLRIVNDVINQRQRGKRAFGSSLARSAELITYITRSVCANIARSLYTDHYDVFTLLVATEKLRLSGQITDEEWRIFCQNATSSGSSTSGECENDVKRPSWITQDIWQGVSELDKLPGFKGLRDSICNKEGFWREYFELPPILMAPTPTNYEQLSVFQRALLWKVFKPDKLYKVCKDLVLYQLGTNATSLLSTSVEETYQASTCITPIIFFMPQMRFSDDWRTRSIKDPVVEIRSLAKRSKINNRLRFISVGGDIDFSKATTILRKSCEDGVWAIINNCHLVKEWSTELLDLFHQITLAGSKEQITDDPDMTRLPTDFHTVTSCIHNQPLVVHPRFRLWLIDVPGVGAPLPNALVRYGLKLAWDSKLDYQSAARQSFVSAWNKQKKCNKLFKQLDVKTVEVDSLFPYLRSLAIFHGLLHERFRYGPNAFNVPYQWNFCDLFRGVEAIHMLKSSAVCSCTEDAPRTNGWQQLSSIIYGGEILDELDWHTLVSISEENHQRHIVMKSGNGSVDILFGKQVVAAEMLGLGLNPLLDNEYNNKVSNRLAESISLIHRQLQQPRTALKQVSYFQDIFRQLSSISGSISKLGDEIATDSSFNAMLQSESEDYMRLLANISSHLEGIIKSFVGEVSLPDALRDIAVKLGNGVVPREWHGGLKLAPSVANWIRSLKLQIQTINTYQTEPPTKPRIVDLAAFSNKYRFFYAILEDWSKAIGRSVHNLAISAEFVSTDHHMDESPPCIYVTGFVLKNASWNSEQRCIEEPIICTEPVKMPYLLLKPSESRKIIGNSLYYSCPLYLTDLPEKSGFSTLLPHILLPTRQPGHVWQQRQVFLTTLCNL